MDSERREVLMKEIWTQTRDWFEHDDGSLPEIEVRNLDREAIQAIFAHLWSRGSDVTGGGAVYTDLRDEQTYPIDSAEAVAALVCNHEAWTHVVLRGLEYAGSQIPDLGVWVLPDGLCFDYRMGSEWGSRQVIALLELLVAIAEMAPEMTVHHEFDQFEGTEVFSSALNRYRETRDTI